MRKQEEEERDEKGKEWDIYTWYKKKKKKKKSLTLFNRLTKYIIKVQGK